MELVLEDDEASLLLRIVRNRRLELRQEIHHTKGTDAREYLQHKEHLLGRILAKFPELDETAHMKGFKRG